MMIVKNLYNIINIFTMLRKTPIRAGKTPQIAGTLHEAVISGARDILTISVNVRAERRRVPPPQRPARFYLDGREVTDKRAMSF